MKMMKPECDERNTPTVLNVWFCPHCGNGRSKFFIGRPEQGSCPQCGYHVCFWGTMLLPEQKEEYLNEQG